jgi:hypothetical protein
LGPTMQLQNASQALCQEIQRCASEYGANLNRYRLESPPIPPGFYWKLRWAVGWLLRLLECANIKTPDPWPARLKHAVGNARSQPLLIWAVGADAAILRTACERLSAVEALASGFAPVLVTDVADFAHYSRLGWFIEYLPKLDGSGTPYDKRKLAFIAKLYGGAPILPYEAGLARSEGMKELESFLGAIARSTSS